MWLPSSQLPTGALVPKASRRFYGITISRAKSSYYGRPPAAHTPVVQAGHNSLSPVRY